MNKSAFAARETELIILGRPPVTGEPSGRLMRLLARDFFRDADAQSQLPESRSARIRGGANVTNLGESLYDEV
jgi:hypothetical protein